MSKTIRAIDRFAIHAMLAAATTALMSLSSLAHAQGGPPMVTDDPGTPGDGKWEINLATIGSHTSNRWEIAVPDADINYGLGERVQLKLDVPWVLVHEANERWKSGLGAANVGIKWRFVDSEQAGFSMSTYPQLTWNWLSSSARRGISAPGREVFLPIEAATEINGFGIDTEVGRNFVQYGQSDWAAGLVVAHACGKEIECAAEVHATAVPHNSQTLLNFGVRWKMNDSTNLLAAAGREFGSHAEDQQHFLFYFGLQLLR